MRIHQFTILAFVLIPMAAIAMPIDATQESIGLYQSDSLQLSTGTCSDCRTIPQALWYFQQELIATPAPDQPISGFSRDFGADNVMGFAAMAGGNEPSGVPQLVWLGSSKVIQYTELSDDGGSLLMEGGKALAFSITEKIPTNLSYFDKSSLEFFKDRPVRLRGDFKADGNGQEFVARIIWPLDFKVLPSVVKPLAGDESLEVLVRANQGGPQLPYSTRTLWQRYPGQMNPQNWAGHAVIGLMLNGAQGDDDEAHGGHFAVLTGRYEADGNWSRWLVNNFYNLDSYSEKGVVAAVTPADKYMMDLNNGQSYYRPSYMLVAIMKDKNVPQQYQASINQVFNHFYHHDFVYNHSKANCAGISVDTLRELGWNLPEGGNGGTLKAIAAYLYVAATSRSLNDAYNVYNYITTEDTRLNPGVAFDVIGEDMLRLATSKADRILNPIEQQFANNVEALIYVHIPQIPSSRVFGQAPVFSFDEYLERAPADRSQWKIVPTEPRPFPAKLREGLALHADKSFVVPLPVAAALAVLLSIFSTIIFWWIQRRKKS